MKTHKGFDLCVEIQENETQVPTELKQNIINTKTELPNGWHLYRYFGPLKPLTPCFEDCCHCGEICKVIDPNFSIPGEHYCKDCLDKQKYIHD